VGTADRVAALSVQLIDVHQALRERRIAAALDTLGPGAWSAEVFAPG
jgi:hypothetical protein